MQETATTASGTDQASAVVAEFKNRFDTLAAQVETVLRGKRRPVHLALVCLFSEGHLLIEDVPGVGKTSLAKAIAHSVGGTWRRVQFTPDLLPSDVTGVSVWDRAKNDFDFRPGGVFANIVLADEINRASPKTQSALLEAMEERQVTVDSVTHVLAAPFMVMATQNPIELEGTYPLPEAQLDRFLMRLRIGYPDKDAELAILDAHNEGRLAPEALRPVISPTEVAHWAEALSAVYVAPELKRYLVELAEASRNHRDLLLGVSPRRARPAALGPHLRRQPRAQLCRPRRHQGARTLGARASHRAVGRGPAARGRAGESWSRRCSTVSRCRSSGPLPRRRGMSFTRRGWTLLGATVGMILAARLLGLPQLLVIGTTLLGLLVICAVWTVTRSDARRRVACPPRAHSRGRRRAGRPHRRERRRPDLGHDRVHRRLRRRGTLGSLPARAARAPRHLRVAYRVPTDTRGRHELGPLVATIGDPFGIARRGWEAAGRREIIVHPRVHEIVPLPGSAVRASTPTRARCSADRTRRASSTPCASTAGRRPAARALEGHGPARPHDGAPARVAPPCAGARDARRARHRAHRNRSNVPSRQSPRSSTCSSARNDPWRW